MTRIEFEVVSAVGRVMFTSDDQALAEAFAGERATTFPGLRVEEVVRTEQRRSIYPPPAKAPSTIAILRRQA